MPVVSSYPSSTTSASTATHTCLVGADGLEFIPSQITANVGDVIEYRFFPQNHSVARAAFGNNLACAPYEDSGPGLVGFWSGFHPMTAVASSPPVYRLRINDTEPIFFYCSSLGACQEGMVGVVNPNSTFTLKAQLSYALNTTISFSPVDGFPSETLESSPTSSSPTATTTISASNHTHSSSSLSRGSIAGIATGSLVAILVFAALLYQCGRYKRMRQKDPASLRQANMTHPRFQIRGPTSDTIRADGIVYPPWPRTQGSANQPTTYHGIGDINTYRYLTPDDIITPKLSSGLTELPHSANQNQIISAKRQGADNALSPPTSAVTAAELRRDTNHAGIAGPHELPAQLHVSPNSSTTSSSRTFSFTDSDRGWHPDDGRLGART